MKKNKQNLKKLLLRTGLILMALVLVINPILLQTLKTVEAAPIPIPADESATDNWDAFLYTNGQPMIRYVFPYETGQFEFFSPSPFNLMTINRTATLFSIDGNTTPVDFKTMTKTSGNDLMQVRVYSAGGKSFSATRKIHVLDDTRVQVSTIIQNTDSSRKQ